MTKSTRESLLDAGLELLGRVGFREWSMRGVEDEAGVPHGSARHHFANQRGLVAAMVDHLLLGDLPQPNETLTGQFARWLGPDAGRTRARYELIVASFHDVELANALACGRDRLVMEAQERGLAPEDATQVAAALDGLMLDAVLRRLPASAVDPQSMADKLQ